MLLLPPATWVAMRARAPLSESPKEKDQELESYMYPIYYHVPRVYSNAHNGAAQKLAQSGVRQIFASIHFGAQYT